MNIACMIISIHNLNQIQIPDTYSNLHAHLAGDCRRARPNELPMQLNMTYMNFDAHAGCAMRFSY